jgi:hypothetical protein
MESLIAVTADRAGLIADLATVLAAHHVNIEQVHARVSGTDAIVHIEVEQVATAVTVLTHFGCQVMPHDVLTLEIENVPGALARIARTLTDSGIDIRMVRTVTRSPATCVVALTTNDNVYAKTLLADRLV